MTASSHFHQLQVGAQRLGCKTKSNARPLPSQLRLTGSHFEQQQCSACSCGTPRLTLGRSTLPDASTGRGQWREPLHFYRHRSTNWNVLRREQRRHLDLRLEVLRRGPKSLCHVEVVGVVSLQAHQQHRWALGEAPAVGDEMIIRLPLLTASGGEREIGFTLSASIAPSSLSQAPPHCSRLHFAKPSIKDWRLYTASREFPPSARAVTVEMSSS